MIYTLTLCFGMFLGTCGAIRRFDFPDRQSCEQERTAQIKAVGGGFAVCAPKIARKEQV